MIDQLNNMASRIETAVRAVIGDVCVGIAILRPSRAEEPDWIVIERPDRVRVRVDLAPGYTPQQRILARDAVLGADLTRRQPRAVAAVLAQIQGLTQGQQMRLFQQVAAEAVVSDPRLARRAGLAFDGDEPATRVEG